MTWLLALILMLLVFAGMAVGVMAGRKPIAGSCGGLAAKLGINHTCTCGREDGCCNAELPPLKEPPADAASDNA